MRGSGPRTFVVRLTLCLGCSWVATSCTSPQNDAQSATDPNVTDADVTRTSNTTTTTPLSTASHTTSIAPATTDGNSRTTASTLDTATNSATTSRATDASNHGDTAGEHNSNTPATSTTTVEPTVATAPESTASGGETTPNGDTRTTDVASTANPSDRCADPELVWRTGHKTHYESYPEPGSEECIEFNGCYWAGMFAACQTKMPEEWVQAHNIVAVFPHFEQLALHDLCIRRGNTTLIVTVYDTCGDSDCDGCCTENRGSADALIDLEKYTNARWGLPDGDVEWADLGPTVNDRCD